MDFKTPKETVDDVKKIANQQKREAMFIKSKSTINGAFWGGGAGLVYAFYKGKNKYTSAMVGLLIGAVVSNILTVKN